MDEDELAGIEESAQQVVGGCRAMTENLPVIVDGILSHDARVASGQLDTVQVGRIIAAGDGVVEALNDLYAALDEAMQRLTARGN